jgi:membrane-associated protein
MLPLIHTSLPHLIETAGLLGIFAMIFCESGMPFGFIFPGDSLLFTAGLLASQGYLRILPLLIGVPLFAIAGASAGYWLGATYGRIILAKKGTFIERHGYLEKTEEFYAKYGRRAVVFARFVPVVRCFVPIFAGVARMRYSTFVAYNALGGLIWGAGVPYLGYTLGQSFPGIERYLFPIAIGIVVVSVIPVGLEYLRMRANKKS